jgi:hypothetical protein
LKVCEFWWGAYLKQSVRFREVPLME